MRYWIYWNDLVQGPFEVRELVSLKAFTTDLPVCEESNQEWTPAAAVSELIPHFKLSEAPATSGAPPPPPPPAPPVTTPLQGEFLNEPTSQQALFDLNGSKHYFFRPAQDAPETVPEDVPPPNTSPFHFGVWMPPPAPPPEPQKHKGGPKPEPKPMLPQVLPPAPRPIDFRPTVEEIGLGAVEPEESTIVEDAVIETEDFESFVREAVTESEPEPEPGLEMTDQAIEIPPAPGVETPVMETPVGMEIPAPIEIPEPVVEKPEPLALPDFGVDEKPLPPPMEPDSDLEEKSRLWPWVVGVWAVMGLVGLGFYVRMNHFPVLTHRSVPAPVRTAPGASVPGQLSIWQAVKSPGVAHGKMNSPAGVAFSPDGSIWVTDQSNHRLQTALLTANAIPTEWTTVGKVGGAPGQFKSPSGVAVDAAGRIWVVDQKNNRVQMYDPSTKKWTALGRHGTAAGEFNVPAGVAIDPQGWVWVADQGNHRLQVYNPATRQWVVMGKKGIQSGEFHSPAGIAFDARARAWVADRGNDRVQVYSSATGKWTSVGKKGVAMGRFNSPAGIAADPQGRIWVADKGNHRLQVFNTTTKTWAVIGKKGAKAGEFFSPVAASFDALGRVWVADQGNHRLQIAAVTGLGLPAAKSIKAAPIVKAPPKRLPKPAAHAAKPKPAVAVVVPKPVVSVGPPKPGVVGIVSKSPATAVPSKPAEVAAVAKPVPAVSVPGMTTPSPESRGPGSEVNPLEPQPSASATDSKWRGMENQAIDLVVKRKIYEGKRTIGSNSLLMLEDMHEKELLHAADTGERLYMPDKLSWSALREEGARYRVYLNFLAWQANGDRTLARSEQFLVGMDKKTVIPADDATRHDFFDPAAMLVHVHSVEADDIQTLLDGVDLVNKQKMRAIVMKDNKQKDEKKKVQAGLKDAQDKFRRHVIYFRTKYAEKTLQNIAKAYDFSRMVK